VTADARTGSRLQDVRRTPAQRRTIAAALELFADHGVSGTSLQMIADALGVTKAAVYHQFNTKNEIVLAVCEDQFADLEAAVETAETMQPREVARNFLLEHVIDVAIARRRWVRALSNDPVMVRLLAEHEPLQSLIVRLYRLILDDEAGTQGVVSVAVLSAAIGATVVHPLVANLDDETLRRELLVVARRLFALTD
jgi:AcrR family transcriptional regulator